MAGGKDKKKPPDRGENHGNSTRGVGGDSPSGNGREIAVQVSPTDLPRAKRRCSTKKVVFLSILVALLAIGIAVYLQKLAHRKIVEEIMIMNLGPEVYSTFSSYDRDGDGYLSLAEFEPLATKLGGEENKDPFPELTQCEGPFCISPLLVKETQLITKPVNFDLQEEDMDPGQEILMLETYFQPLLLETMSQDKDIPFYKPSETLQGLVDWKETFQQSAPFNVKYFQAFLPEDSTPVGTIYTLIDSNLNQFTNQLSSNRYYPPVVHGNRASFIHKLLSMFHPRPFVHSRFGPQGSVAVVRAESEKFLDIVFRIHAEFQLNEPPRHPFWFTPAQFTGNIIVAKDSSHVEHFHLYVPANKTLNVDMEWLNGPVENENMEVDIGRMPQMELRHSMPSAQVPIYGENGEVLFEPPAKTQEAGPIVWTKEIVMEEAMSILETRMYPFKKVPYLSFTDAFSEAQQQNKLVHHILLWGALDDQSC